MLLTRILTNQVAQHLPNVWLNFFKTTYLMVLFFLIRWTAMTIKSDHVNEQKREFTNLSSHRQQQTDKGWYHDCCLLFYCLSLQNKQIMVHWFHVNIVMNISSFLYSLFIWYWINQYSLSIIQLSFCLFRKTVLGGAILVQKTVPSKYLLILLNAFYFNMFRSSTYSTKYKEVIYFENNVCRKMNLKMKISFSARFLLLIIRFFWSLLITYILESIYTIKIKIFVLY